MGKCAAKHGTSLQLLDEEEEGFVVPKKARSSPNPAARPEGVQEFNFVVKNPAGDAGSTGRFIVTGKLRLCHRNVSAFSSIRTGEVMPNNVTCARKQLCCGSRFDTRKRKVLLARAFQNKVNSASFLSGQVLACKFVASLVFGMVACADDSGHFAFVYTVTCSCSLSRVAEGRVELVTSDDSGVQRSPSDLELVDSL